MRSNRFRIIALSLLLLGSGCTRDRDVGDKDKLPFGGKTLNILNWNDYIDKDLIAEFEKKTGAKVTYDEFSSDGALEAKLFVSNAAYDVVFPSDRSMVPLVKRDVLAELDRAKLPNWKHLDSKFLKPRFDPENRYSAPYFWGTLAVGVRTDHVKDPVKGFEALFDERYKGRICMLNDAESVVAAAMLHLGAPMNSTDDADLARAKDLLVQQARLVSAYTNDGYKEKLIKGEAWIALGWSGDISQARESNPAIATIVPATGTLIYVDSMAIPKSAPNPELAHAFINFLLDPDVAARNSNFAKYATPNQSARAKVDAKLLEDRAVYPGPELIDKCQWLQDRGGAIRKIERLWKDIPK